MDQSTDVSTVDVEIDGSAALRAKRKNATDDILPSPKRQKVAEILFSQEPASAAAAAPNNDSNREDSTLSQLSKLEQEFIATIGVPEEQARSQEILAELRSALEAHMGRSLEDKREDQLNALYAIDGVRECVERIRATSGFKETKQLLKYIDLIQYNMKTAEASPSRRAELDKLTRELRRMIQRIQAVQTRMQRLTLKVNLPRSADTFAEGCGEGCFVVVEETTKALFDVNREGGIYVGILLNSPVYKEWFHLQEGDPVLFCMKGQLRPVAFVDQTSMVEQLRGLFNSEGLHIPQPPAAATTAASASQ